MFTYLLFFALSSFSGSLFLYQMAQYQGDSLEVKESIKKVYHSTAGMEIRSYKSTGKYKLLF